MKTETKVGMFFIVALLVIGIITFQVEDLGTALRPRYELRAHVTHAAGLAEGDSVNVAGVKVGSVRELKLQDDRIEIVMRIEGQHRIRENAVGSIAWTGLLGSRHIDITMGSSDRPFKSPGDEVMMKDAYRLDDLFENIESALVEVEDLITGERAGEIAELASKLDVALSAAGELLEDVKEGRGVIGRLFADDELYGTIEEIAANLKQTSDEINRISSEHGQDFEEILASIRDMSPQAKETIASLQRIAEQAEKGEGPLGKLLTDEKLAADIENTVELLKNFAQQLEEGEGMLSKIIADENMAMELEETLKSLRTISDRLESGEGTIGKLMFDDELYEEIMAIVSDAREMIRSVKEQVPVGSFSSVIMGAF